jgi:hypothetical protein
MWRNQPGVPAADCVPTHYARARVNVLWGSEQSIPTDNWYAQAAEATDEAPAPKLAVGRLAVSTPAELQQLVTKTLLYECCEDYGPWRQRLNFVAGTGGFGALADMVLESATQYFLTENIPAAYQLSMTYGSWRSPYCPDPRLFRQATLARLNEGAWFWVYIGHGHPLGLDHVYVPGGEYPILDAADAAKLNCQTRQPIALFLSCYAGALDARRPCLAEAMLRAPGGPVAILAGSRVTMPYGLGVLGTGLMRQCFREHRATLGDAILVAKQAMLPEGAANDPQRAVLDNVATAISPDPKLRAAERAEHVLLMNLLGDPLLRLHYAKELTLKVPSRIAAGTPLVVQGACPLAGQATVELAVRRGRLKFPAPSRIVYPHSETELAQLQAVYSQANDRRLSAVQAPIRAGHFQVTLPIPEREAGDCQVTVFVRGDGDFASAAAAVNVVAKSLADREEIGNRKESADYADLRRFRQPGFTPAGVR